MVVVNGGSLSRMSLAEAIRVSLREKILSGELAMGERITEQKVAKSMGTSAGPVREAFAGLVHEGLLITLPNRGTFVASASEEEARDAYAVRHRLEPLAFELARGQFSDAANRELDELIDGLLRAAKEADYPTMIGLDMRFHGIFFEHSGNSLLQTLWPMIEGKIRKFVAVAGPHHARDLIELAKRHEKLLEDFRRGDMKAVARELSRHGQDIWQRLPSAPGSDAEGDKNPGQRPHTGST